MKRKTDAFLLPGCRMRVIDKSLCLAVVVAIAVSTLGMPQRADTQEQSTDAGPPLYRVLRNGSWGYIDALGNVRAPIQYDYAFPFRNGYSVVRRGDYQTGKRAFIDSSGELVTEFLFDRAYHFVSGFGTAMIDGKWGFVSSGGRAVGGFIWDAIRDFQDGYAMVRVGGYRDGRWGILDTDGFVILPVEYERITNLGEQRWAARKDGAWAIFRPGISEPEQFIYSEVGRFRDGQIAVTRANPEESGRPHAILDLDLTEVYATADPIEHVSEGIVAVKVNDRIVYRDLGTDRVVGDPKGYDQGYTFSEGVAIVGVGSNWRDRRWGILGRNGRYIAEPTFHRIYAANENGLMRVALEDTYGYILRDGTIVVDPTWEHVGDFSDDRCPVMRDGRWGYVNTAGDLVIPLKYDYAWDFIDGIAVVRSGDEAGGVRTYITPDGTQAFDGEFEWAYAFDGLLAHVAAGDFADGEFGYIDRSGTVVWELQN